MMEQLAASFMGIKNAEFMQQYAVSLQKLAMDTQGEAIDEIDAMLSELPSVPKGEFLDVYA